MAPLSASILNNHSLYDFPRPVLLSPPGTASELEPPMQPTSMSQSTPVMFGELARIASRPLQTETLPSKPRRVSTLTYNNSSLREPQERSIHKSSKSLVVIVPPESFTQEHGQLGHTLSSGPRNRLSHGVLMPLCSTMYAQLTAIAREFNFPSTLGLCLYLQLSDNGITVTPRISDESWQFLWGHCLNGSKPVTPHGLPISGRIEFDIDLNKARWYASWIAGSRRDTILSHTPSMSHSRDDSRTMLVDEQVDDEQQKNALLIQPTQNQLRHTPKKLALLSRPVSRSGTVSPEAAEAQIISALSPIIQNDEPPTAKRELETRVNSWRENTSLAPVHETQSGNPKTAFVDDHPVTPQERTDTGLNLNDFTWSISSAGPPSERLDSPVSCERLPSVHLDRRLQSVCLTPSVCTTFGPFDYDLHSPMTDVSRLPSPDIAYRMIDDSPPTPSTATSWGAPLSYPPSPLSEYRPPSIHLDRRGEFSIPTTPAIATTRGPLMSYPSGPITPDAGQRASDPRNTSSTYVWRYVWPYCQDHFCIDSDPATSQKADECEVTIFASNYPHLKIYPDVYPYYNLYPAVAASQVAVMESESLSITLQTSYPNLNIYPACYPHFDIYPVMHLIEEPTTAQLPLHPVSIVTSPSYLSYPHFDCYPVVSPAEVLPCPSIKLDVEYPFFDLYPAVYPFVTPYPSHNSNSNIRQISQWYELDAGELEVYPIRKVLPVMVETIYPTFNIYPAVYPAFDIYPSVHEILSLGQTNCMPPSPSRDCSFSVCDTVVNQEWKDQIMHDGHALGYPVFNIYPAVYPHLEPYPAWWADTEQTIRWMG